MAKITWLGEDSKTVPGPSFNLWNGKKFPKGKAVEVTDPEMIKSARTNHFYKVSEEKPKEAPRAEATETKTPEPQAESKPQAQAEADDGRGKAEKGPGYSPVKKRVRKHKPKAHASGHAHRG